MKLLLNKYYSIKLQFLTYLYYNLGIQSVFSEIISTKFQYGKTLKDK